MDENRKPVSILSVAKRLGELSGWTLTNLQLQRIAYIGHMYCLGEDGFPLVEGTFEACDVGPTHPTLYRELKKYGYGSGHIGPKELTNAEDMPDEHCGVRHLNASVNQLPRDKLVGITQWKSGAWARYYDSSLRHVVIPNEDIIAEYKLRLERYEQRKAGHHPATGRGRTHTKTSLGR